MKVFFLIFLMPLFVGALAPADSVVKLNSNSGVASVQARTGSGLVILWQGHSYVLTSDHVVYHSNRNFSHEMVDAQGTKHELEYLTSDAGRGLALLKLKTADPSVASYDLTLQSGDGPVVGDALTMMGYPAESDALLIDKKGKIHDLHFATETFVQIPELIEVSGGHGEFGMSGGAAFSALGVYRGLLSHQIVSNQGDVVLLISPEEVRQWLGMVLNSSGDLASPSPVELFQDPAQQVSDFLSYRTGNLYFAFSNAYGKGSALSAAVMSSKDRSTEKLYAGDNGPFSQIQFKPRLSVICMGFRQKKIFGEFVSAPQRVNEFLRKAADPDVEPLWTYSGPGGRAQVQAARAMRPQFLTLADRLETAQALQLAAWVREIAARLEFTKTGDPFIDAPDEDATGAWRLIKPRDLDFVVNDPSLSTDWGRAEKDGVATQVRGKIAELLGHMEWLTF